MKMPSILKNITPIGILSKTAGGLALYTVLRDSHAHGKLIAEEHKNEKNAEAGLRYFNNTQYLTNKSESTAKMKEKLFEWELDDRIRGAWNSTAGYIHGFWDMLTDHSIPLASSMLALGLKGKKALIGVAGLAAHAIYTGIVHVCSHLDKET